jgi:hypothetical protein
MPVLRRGHFEVDLKLFKLGGELTDDDRQCAWELYTEISTRVAVVGKSGQKTSNFDGEIYVESLDSLYRFFNEARGIMREFPVGRIAVGTKDHLGVLIHAYIRDILRPFLETWHANFRHWWEHESDKTLRPFDRQSHYPALVELLKDWAILRWFMRKLQAKLVTTYKLVDVDA